MIASGPEEELTGDLGRGEAGRDEADVEVIEPVEFRGGWEVAVPLASSGDPSACLSSAVTTNRDVCTSLEE